MKINDLVIQLSNLTQAEMSELANALSEKWGVSLNSPTQYVPPGFGDITPLTEAKTSFTVTLVSFAADKKISVIKVLREVKAGTGLAEAKALAETSPKVILENVSLVEAESAKKRLEAAGAQVSVE